MLLTCWNMLEDVGTWIAYDTLSWGTYGIKKRNALRMAWRDARAGKAHRRPSIRRDDASRVLGFPRWICGLVKMTGWWFGTWLDYDFPYFSIYFGNNYIIIPTDELLFFRVVGIPPTRMSVFPWFFLWVFVEMFQDVPVVLFPKHNASWCQIWSRFSSHLGC